MWRGLTVRSATAFKVTVAVPNTVSPAVVRETETVNVLEPQRRQVMLAEAPAATTVHPDGLAVQAYVDPDGAAPEMLTEAGLPSAAVVGAVSVSVAVAPRTGAEARNGESAVFQCVLR